MKLLGVSATLCFLMMLSVIPISAFASDYCTDYSFYVYEMGTNNPISNATITIVYKTINWGPEDVSSWSNRTVTGRTNSSGLATIYCMDVGYMGLFDVGASNYFGPYGQNNMVISIVKCEASGYTTLTLTAGTTFPSDSYRAGGDRGEGLTLYLSAGGSGTGTTTSSSTTSGIIEYNDLDWRVGPDSSTNWYEADHWVESLGGSWRMPTRAELQALYDAGINYGDSGPFELSGYCVWSGEVIDTSFAWTFDFTRGSEFQDGRDYSSSRRAFAVRSR